MLQVPVLTCKETVGAVFTKGSAYEVQSYITFNEGEEVAEVLVIDDQNEHHYLSMEWLSEHFDLEGDLELVLEKV